jgi:hypothetical protein
MKIVRNLTPSICTGILLAFALLLSASAQDKLKTWHSFDFGKKKVTKTQLAKLEHEDLQLLRGIVFGKRGRVFKEKTIQEYLEKQAWYKPKPNFSNSVLTVIERQNLDLIREAEAKHHGTVEAGDLRFWQKKAIPEDKIWANTSAEWRVLIAEVEAIHGKTFPDEPWLQKYFEERYWYKANPNYSSAVLTEIERKNLDTIMKKHDSERKTAVSPGDMDKFQDVLLTEKMLEGVTMSDLHIMKNEFWARRGRKFTAPGIRSFFEWQDWYRPAKDQKTVKLSETELQNVRLIEAAEAKMRDKIATEPVTAEMFEGLFTEDLRLLRNEIYARRGKVFKSKDLNEYFIVQAWYKPDPDFKDEMLSETERKNLAVIKEAETNAISKFSEVEG